MNEEFYEKHFQRKAILIEELTQINDIHLVLDFDKVKKWGDAQAEHSNRLFLNHDEDNCKFNYMDKLFNFITNEYKEKIDLIGLGGFQLLNNRDLNDNLVIMKRLAK